MTMNYIGKREHFIKNSHGRCLVGAFDKKIHGGSIYTGPRAVLYFILNKSIFLHFINHGTKFYYKYIKPADKKIYIDGDGSGIFPKQNVRNIYNAKYHGTYANQDFF